MLPSVIEQVVAQGVNDDVDVEVKPKTWRIFTFADDNWYHHHANG